MRPRSSGARSLARPCIPRRPGAPGRGRETRIAAILPDEAVPPKSQPPEWPCDDAAYGSSASPALDRWRGRRAGLRAAREPYDSLTRGCLASRLRSVMTIIPDKNPVARRRDGASAALRGVGLRLTG